MKIRNPDVRALPDAKIDRCVFGFNGTFRDPELKTVSSIRDRLTPFGQLKRTNERHFQLDIPLQDEENDLTVGVLRANLYFAYNDSGILQLIDRSSLELNPQKVERGLLGEDACGPRGFDKKDNVLGHRYRGPETLRRLLDILHQGVAYFLDMMQAVAPEGWEPGQVWLKAIEACRDVEVNDSVSAMHVIQRSALAGSTAAVRDAYLASATQTGRLITVKWRERSKGPEHKVYGKLRDTVRIELACPNHDAVVLLTGRSKKALTAENAASLAAKFAQKSAPCLNELEAHVWQVVTKEHSISRLLVELAPLIAMAAGISRGRGPKHSQESQQAAEDAVGSFLSIGFFDATEIRKEHAVRKVLDELCSEGGPLQRGPGAIYYLQPRYSRASSQLDACRFAA